MTTTELSAVGGSRCAFLTQKERDTESGLDYFLARYYSAAEGRFTSADSFEVVVDAANKQDALAFMHDPGRWNKYSYVTNNPLRYFDPDGQQQQDLADMWRIHKEDYKQRTGRDLVVPGNRTMDKVVIFSMGPLVVGPAAMILGKLGAAGFAWGMFQLAVRPQIVQAVAAIALETAGGPPGAISGAPFTKAEMSIAQKLAGEGRNVEKLAESTVQGVKSADFLVSGVKFELKTLGGIGSTNVKNALSDAAKQSDNAILDARNANVTLQQAKEGAMRAFGAHKNLNVVRIIGKDYDITVARKKT